MILSADTIPPYRVINSITGEEMTLLTWADDETGKYKCFVYAEGSTTRLKCNYHGIPLIEHRTGKFHFERIKETE